MCELTLRTILVSVGQYKWAQYSGRNDIVSPEEPVQKAKRKTFVTHSIWKPLYIASSLRIDAVCWYAGAGRNLLLSSPVVVAVSVSFFLIDKGPLHFLIFTFPKAKANNFLLSPPEESPYRRGLRDRSCMGK
jgi:hypothetical protein